MTQLAPLAVGLAVVAVAVLVFAAIGTALDALASRSSRTSGELPAGHRLPLPVRIGAGFAATAFTFGALVLAYGLGAVLLDVLAGRR